jgi:two-component system nitrogen regulation sensor histidine kinase GlnL
MLVPDAQRQLASLPLAVLLIGPELTIEGANPAAEQLLCQGARRLLGRKLRDVLAFEEPRISRRLDERDAQISARAVLTRIEGQAGRLLDVMLAPVTHSSGWQLLALHEKGGIDALGGAGPAIGEGSVLRAPEILAHEIKNPLAGIRGAAQLLARKLDAADLPLAELITDEVDRIAKLIDQMQSLTRKTTDPATPCNLHQAVRRAQAVLAAAQSQPIIFIEEFDPSLPPVLCSADSLVRVLLNLLTNAGEACADAAVPTVKVRTRFASGIRLNAGSDGESIRLPIELRVSDNGPGVDPRLGDEIFQPFVTGKRNGQGLGLALVQKLVAEMNGRITHDRDQAAGLTHFRLHLPMASRRSERAATSVAA